ncbi:hypothetical protein [uncultured Alistipes sp.]|uniref:hypothetical protein n=1 Tax=uncultured Alistipes sp. TaxID=538949 RepID=UPI0032203F1C
MGLPHAIAVTTADVTDRDGAIQMILLNLDNLSHVEKFLVDAGYSGERFANQVKDICGAQVEVVKRSELPGILLGRYNMVGIAIGIFKGPTALVKDFAAIAVSEAGAAAKRGGRYRGMISRLHPGRAAEIGGGIIVQLRVPDVRFAIPPLDGHRLRSGAVCGRAHAAYHDDDKSHRRNFGKQSGLFHDVHSFH